MNFFEYLFCRLYWWNTVVIKEEVTPLFYSILGLSVFHTYTIVPLYNIAFVLIYKTYYLEEILALSPYFIINIIRVIILITNANKLINKVTLSIFLIFFYLFN